MTRTCKPSLAIGSCKKDFQLQMHLWGRVTTILRHAFGMKKLYIENEKHQVGPFPKLFAMKHKKPFLIFMKDCRKLYLEKLKVKRNSNPKWGLISYQQPFSVHCICVYILPNLFLTSSTVQRWPSVHSNRIPCDGSHKPNTGSLPTMRNCSPNLHSLCNWNLT